MRTLLIILFLVAATGGQAQQKKRWKYGSFYTAGLVTGASGDALAVQTVQGAWSKRFFAGLGTGLDWYYARSLPLFADLRYKLHERKKASFVYFDIGGNLATGKNEPEFPSPFYNYEFKGGIYLDAGVGYLLPIRKLGTAVLLTAGYSQKSMKETQTLKPEFDTDQPWPVWWGARKYETDYIFRRWTIKLGLAL